ncbi:MAG: hypothetical protein M3224_01955 [Thermoproteota archaeon]|nr:hypothetical protein [Thermoproteota archaeon]
MTLISREEAKAKLLDCKILLKYMVFLQNNGFSDCGKGQIMGQAALLEEYLKEEEQKQYKGTFDKQHKQIEEHEKQIMTKSTEEVAKISETFRENTTNIYKGLLRQVGNMMEKPKDIKDTNSNYAVKKEDPKLQTFQRITQPIGDATINGKGIGGSGENKEMGESWRDKIKRMTQVDIR